MKKELIVVRGVSGSGKTTVAELFGVRVYSADDYFTHESGFYDFHREELGLAHKQCQDHVEWEMKNNYEKVVVANTFTVNWEMKPYFDMAKKYGYRVHTIVVENRHGSKSIHDVPDAILNNQRDRFEVVL